ncbi:MAG TPA: hypothetical protein DCM14_00045, partial [Clostridiales bacterium UBA8153]|nr:hypothetical protein [Clostridiales bacterium UBA8153]
MNIDRQVLIDAGILKKPPREVAEERGQDKPNQAQVLVELAGEAIFIFTPRGDVFASVPVGQHRENWPVRGKGFRRWLVRRFAEVYDKPPGAQALQDAIGLLEARAETAGQRGEVHTRLAERDGAIYLDLGNAAWQAVEVTASGWRLVSEPPVFFWRPRGMLPLPAPQAGGTLAELAEFVNLGEERARVLAISWLLAAARPQGPYLLLMLHGEQGTGKTLLARFLKALLDPSAVEVRTSPRDERDLMIAAANNWVLAFDNLSGLSGWLSDGLCRLAS